MHQSEDILDWRRHRKCWCMVLECGELRYSSSDVSTSSLVGHTWQKGTEWLIVCLALGILSTQNVRPFASKRRGSGH